MKKASVIALILGILMLLTSVVLPVISVITSITASANQSTGIIGGADTPTFLLLFSIACDGFPTFLAIIGFLFITASIVIRFIAKKKEI